jgi:tRNA (guanosine-2'-O-)-methyltransferase
VPLFGWVGDPLAWLAAKREAGSHVLGVELADEAIRLPAAWRRTVAVLRCACVEIPLTPPWE